MRRSTARRFVRITGWIAVGLSFAIALTPVTNDIARAFEIPSRIEKASAIVVLGAGLKEDGELSDESMRRAILGIALYAKQLAPLVVFSGPGLKVKMPTEARLRAQMAQELGVPSEAILTVDDARTTLEESVRIADLLSTHGKKRILLVTDSLHMRRASSLFESANYEVLAVPSDPSARTATTVAARLTLARRLTFETAALLYYKMAGRL